MPITSARGSWEGPRCRDNMERWHSEKWGQRTPKMGKPQPPWSDRDRGFSFCRRGQEGGFGNPRKRSRVSPGEEDFYL